MKVANGERLHVHQLLGFAIQHALLLRCREVVRGAIGITRRLALRHELLGRSEGEDREAKKNAKREKEEKRAEIRAQLAEDAAASGSADAEVSEAAIKQELGAMFGGEVAYQQGLGSTV